MPAADKTLERMRANPLDWRIADLEAVARAFNVSVDKPGGSHVTFRAPDGTKVTVPARRRIKPVYIRQFVAMIDRVKTRG